MHHRRHSYRYPIADDRRARHDPRPGHHDPSHDHDSRSPTRVTTTTADPRPGYCTDYDTWTAADVEMDGLERRHGVDVSTWPAADVDRLFAAMDRRAATVERVWARADESATITSVRAACTG